MGWEHGDNDQIVLAALGLVDGGGVREFQFSQALQRIVGKAAIKIDDDCAGADGIHHPDLTVEYSRGDWLIGPVMQNDVVVILHLHHPVVQPEQFPAKCNLGLARFRRIDFLSDGLVQPVGGSGALRTKGGENLYLFHAGMCQFGPVDLADQLRNLLLRVGLNEGEIPAIVQVAITLPDKFGIVGDQAVLGLTENLVKHRYRHQTAFNQLPEHTACAHAFQLVGVAYQQHLFPGLQPGK